MRWQEIYYEIERGDSEFAEVETLAEGLVLIQKAISQNADTMPIIIANNDVPLEDYLKWIFTLKETDLERIVQDAQTIFGILRKVGHPVSATAEDISEEEEHLIRELAVNLWIIPEDSDFAGQDLLYDLNISPLWAWATLSGAWLRPKPLKF